MPRRFYLLVSLATLAGAGLRLWQLALIPPGLHYDLAATALIGNDVAFGGYRPLFITAFTGHEVLFYYWLALWFRLIGSSVFALRLAAALVGILTIPATFFAVREAMRFDEHSLIIAAFAAALLACAFFHVAFSRFGFRVISQPLIQALALGFLLRGLNRLSLPASHIGRRTPDFGPVSLTLPPRTLGFAVWDFVLAGFFTGLAAYTYLSARFFPIPLAVFWLALLLTAFRQARRPTVSHSGHSPAPPLGPAAIGPSSPVFSSFVIFTLVVLITFAPLGVYFIQHPQDFVNRASQVAPRLDESALLFQGFRRAAEMIFVSGEPYDRYNLPGLPLLSPLLGLFFVIGLLITLRNLVRPRPFAPGPSPLALGPSPLALGPSPSATELLLLSWLPAMLLPTALAVHDIFPSTIRALGVAPLLFVYPARGIIASYRWLQARWPGPLIPHAYPLTLLCLLTLAGGTVLTGRGYFAIWANLPNQRLNNDADLTAIADYLNAQDLSGTAVFVSAIHYRHPTLAYLAHDFQSIRWLFGGTSLAIPRDQAALYVFSRSTPLPQEWIAGWESHLVASPLDPDNVPTFRAYRFAAGESPPLPEFTPVSENFGNAASLTGYRLTPGESQIVVDLRWRIESLIGPADAIPYLRLSDAWGSDWSQSGGFNYPSEQWQPGDTLLTRVSVPLPAGLPPGNYTLEVVLYSEATQSNLPHLDRQGGFAGQRVALPPIYLPGGPRVDVESFVAANPMTVAARSLGLDRDLDLLGYALPRTSIRQGEYFDLTLFWHAPAPVSADALSLSLGDLALFSGRPVQDTFSFSEWSRDQLLADRYRLKVPADFPPGPVELGVSVPGYGSAALATLEVMPVERAFARPESATQAGDRFNHFIALDGYDLAPGASTRLTLVWQSLAPTATDYTVFVHVLDSAGQVAAQADSQPRGGAYPTSLWVPGEFVTDAYTFALPPGPYSLEVGLYLLEDGRRLPVFDADGASIGDALRLPEFQVP